MTASRITAPFFRPPPLQRSPSKTAVLDKLYHGRREFVADCDAFDGIVAGRYYQICDHAIKAADPTHLYLGAKDGNPPPNAVMEQAAKYCDVISVDFYGYYPGVCARLAAEARFERPIIISEWSFRARDSGLPNSIGSGPLVNTQAQRAAEMRLYITHVLHIPNVVGYAWFKYVDEPRQGRPGDGENSNYGLLNRQGKPYRLLVNAFKKINAHANGIHAHAAQMPHR